MWGRNEIIFFLTCCCSVTKLCLSFVTPWTAVCQIALSFTISRVGSKSCPLSRWRYLTISSSVTSVSFCLQSFPACRSFPMNWLFASGGQSVGASASVLSMNIQGWFPLGLTNLISFPSNGLSRVFSSTSLKASILWCSAFFMVQLQSYTWLVEKPQPRLYRPLFAKWYLCFLIHCLSLS